jgi:hypothetical protein
MSTRQNDAAYKLLFAHPDMVAQLIRGLIPDPWIDRLDFQTLRPVTGDLVSDRLVKKNADCVWQVDAPDRKGHLLIHIEFQNTIDPTMPLRMSVYSGLLLQTVLRRKRKCQTGKWPPVLSVVLYNGARPWRASVKLSDHIRRAPTGLLKVTPEHRFVLIDIRRQNPQHLDKLNNTVGLLLQFEQPHSYEDSVQRLVRLKQMHLNQHALRRDIGTWVLEVTGNSSLLQTLVQEFVNPKGTIMNMDREYKAWVKRMKAQGFSQGISQQDLLDLLSSVATFIRHFRSIDQIASVVNTVSVLCVSIFPGKSEAVNFLLDQLRAEVPR